MRIVITTFFALACLALALPAQAGGGCQGPECCVQACAPTCCASCGQKVCRLVRGVKEVKKTVWVVECEEFCLPNPRCTRKCCQSSCREATCGDTCDGCCADGKCHSRCLVPPRCGPVRCRKKLIKKEITCKVPIYKCVVCGACCEGCVGDENPAASDKGNTPKGDAPMAPSPTAWRQ